jgi:MFS family permease
MSATTTEERPRSLDRAEWPPRGWWRWRSCQRRLVQLTFKRATNLTTDDGPAAGDFKRDRSRHGFGFWAVAFAFLVVLAHSTVPTPLYAIYQARSGFSSFAITLIFAAYALGVLASLFMVGHLSDWHGRRRLLVPALATAAVSAVVFLVWRDLAGLIVARILCGLSVGATCATAAAWIGELHAAHRPRASPRRAQIVSTGVNVVGIGVGSLVAGMLAQWVRGPLTTPYLVSIAALVVATVGVLLAPETRDRARPRPAYRLQRIAVPAHARAAYFAAAAGAAISFATFGLFTSLSPSFLAGTLGHTSHALAGATAFSVFAAGTILQTLISHRPRREALVAGMGLSAGGLVLVVASVWLPHPTLALFLAGGIVAGAGAGALFKGVVATVADASEPSARAEALAGMFLAAYLGLSVPVLGLGVLTEYLTGKSSLLIFAAVLVTTMLAASKILVPRTSLTRHAALVMGPRTRRGSASTRADPGYPEVKNSSARRVFVCCSP